MVGKNFKQGYACVKCHWDIDLSTLRRTPLYERENQKYTFSGFVKCPLHGIQKGIPLKEL